MMIEDLIKYGTCTIDTVTNPFDHTSYPVYVDTINTIQEEFRGQAVKHDPILLNMQRCFIALLFYDIDVFKIIKKYKLSNKWKSSVLSFLD